MFQTANLSQSNDGHSFFCHLPSVLRYKAGPRHFDRTKVESGKHVGNTSTDAMMESVSEDVQAATIATRLDHKD